MKKMIAILAVLTVVAFAGSVMAQQTKPAPAPAPSAAPAAPEKGMKAEKPAKAEKFSGTIQSVDEAGKMITVKGKKEEKTFSIAAAKITRGKTELAFADLKQGTDVSVEYKKEGDKNIATAIKAAAPKAGKKAPAKKEAAPKEGAAK